MRIIPLSSLAILALVACTSTADSLTLAFNLENERTDEFGKTTHDLFLVFRDPTSEGSDVERVELGSYDGCGTQAAPEDGPLLTLSCWFAGGGDDFQVRMDGTNTLVVDHRIVDEEAEIPEFEPLKTVTIPEGITLMPVAPAAK